MARLTRNSYKRKIILFGAFVFMSIALISTGFAAWVMSNDAEESAGGNVSVGLVSDASLKITVDKTQIENFTFQFEPAKEDYTGRVRLDSTNPIAEALVLEFTGTISNPSILATDGLTVQMSIPAGLQEAINKNYIVAPDCVANAKALTVDAESGAFTCTIEFKWGTAFGGINPSLYFEEGQAGASETDENVKTILEDLRAYVYGYYDEFATKDRATVIEEHKNDAMPKFTVTLIAKAN